MGREGLGASSGNWHGAGKRKLRSAWPDSADEIPSELESIGFLVTRQLCASFHVDKATQWVSVQMKQRNDNSLSGPSLTPPRAQPVLRAKCPSPRQAGSCRKWVCLMRGSQKQSGSLWCPSKPRQKATLTERHPQTTQPLTR